MNVDREGGIINEILDKVQARLEEAFSGVLGIFSLNWLPEIFFWYVYLGLLFLVVAVGIYLFGWSKIVRMVLSIIFGLAAIFVAGGAVMAERLKRREAAKKPPRR
jgi:cellulose synthase/poly-beta-1,6-N-acetylglucosamine synthase-like glycosyltransferase